MATLVYVPNRNMIINIDQVTDVKYSPRIDQAAGFSAKYNEHLPEIHENSSIIVTLTSVQIAELTGWDGSHQGTACEAQVIKLHGADADMLWSQLIALCVNPV